MPASRLAGSLFVLSAFAGYCRAQDCSQTCQSFGKDFVDGGSYFQNVASTAPFTATEYFEGCQNDTAYNILQDPSGNQYECNNTPMVPDGAIQNLTCPIDKNQLTSGEWSIIILSNNGDCDPIDYIRTFSLSVGTQATTTVPPTVVVSSTSTPVVTTTSTIFSTITSTARPSTTTVERANPYTITIYPLPTITVVTVGIFSVTHTVRQPSVATTTTVTTTPPCAVHKPNVFAQAGDQVNTAVKVTILKNVPLTIGLARRDAIPEPTARAGSLEHKRAMLEGRISQPQPEVANMEVQKRAPDPPTITVTSGAPVTSTTTFTASTTTVGVTTTTFTTTTTTPTVTVTRGQSPPATTTAPQFTITATVIVPLTTVVTTRYSTTITVTSTASKCTQT